MPEPQAPSSVPLTGLLALFVTLPLCAAVVLSTPRALLPEHLPPLVLDARLSAQAEAADVALAARAPGGVDVDELAARYLEEGRAELARGVEQAKVEIRRAAFLDLARRVFARVKPAGVAALRAQATLQFWAAFQGEEIEEEVERGLFGGLPGLLRTYGLTSADGQRHGPALCVRTQFKARWNLIHDLPIPDGFSPIEVQAFEGWIALHAANAPLERRFRAARAFYGAGGYRGAQALATWFHRMGMPEEARRMMVREHASRNELFVRNYVIGLTAAAL